MTIEELKAIAGNLYKNAEEATPIIGDGEKNEWMAHRLDEIVDENYPALDCLMNFTMSSEVTDYLEKEYEQRKKDIEDREMPCDAERSSINLDKERVMSSNQQYNQNPDVIIEEEIIIVDTSMDDVNRPSDKDRINLRNNDCGC